MTAGRWAVCASSPSDRTKCAKAEFWGTPNSAELCRAARIARSAAVAECNVGCMCFCRVQIRAAVQSAGRVRTRLSVACHFKRRTGVPALVPPTRHASCCTCRLR